MSHPAASVIAYVGLGGNLGDAASTLRSAALSLAQLPGSRMLAASRLYRSSPLGRADQPDYYNAVVKLRTGLSPGALLEMLLAVESEFGRVRTGERWGPRTLDLDLLLHGGTVCSGERLTLPHPGMRERAFVLYPLAEIEPGLVLPQRERVADLLTRVPAEGLECVGALIELPPYVQDNQ